MRILFCVNSLGAFGGMERVTIVKANALAEIEGNEVAICYTDKGEWPKTIHPLSSKVKTFDLQTPYWGFASAKAFVKAFPSQVMKTRKALDRIIEKFEPDVVISTGSYEKFALALSRSRRQNGKRIVKIREYHFNSTYRRYSGKSKVSHISALITEQFEKHILSRFFDKSFLLTQSDKEENFKRNSRFDYMYNPCSFSPKSVPAYTGRKKTVLAVGRLTYQKNFEVLIDIWSQICDLVPNWRLRIVGNGGV